MLDLSKYKTYDTSNGFGSPEEWKANFSGRKEYFEFTMKNVDEFSEKKELKQCKDLKELNKQFRKLMLFHHPDIAGDTKENTEKTQIIIAQYEKLKKKLNGKRNKIHS